MMKLQTILCTGVDGNGLLNEFDTILVTRKQGCLGQFKILKNGFVQRSNSRVHTKSGWRHYQL